MTQPPVPSLERDAESSQAPPQGSSFATGEASDTAPVAAPPGGLRETLLGWERLRVVYNVILLTAYVWVFLAGDNPMAMFTVLMMVQALAMAFAANVLFFAGPLAELYLKYIGMRAPWARPALFALGTVYSVFLTVNTITVLLGYRR